MTLQNSDLLYLDQGGSGTLYQVTWERINTRQVDPTDELLVQRGSFLYQVPIGDFWNGLDVSEVNDLYLVERNFTLYHTEILFSAGASCPPAQGTTSRARIHDTARKCFIVGLLKESFRTVI